MKWFNCFECILIPNSLLLLLVNLITTTNATTLYHGPSIVNKGSEFMIQCITAKINPIKWLKDSEQLPVSDHYIIMVNSTDEHNYGILTIPDGQVSDSGHYTCTMDMSDVGHSISVFYDGITVSPVYVNDSTYIRAEYRKPIDIECKVTNINNFTIKWTKDSKPVEASDRVSVSDKIHIAGAKEEDHGKYRCDVYRLDPPGTESLGQAEVNVKFFPFVYMKDKDLTVIEENPLNVTCRVYGHLKEVNWRFENDTAYDENKRNITYLNDDNGVKDAILHITSATKMDRGNYSCYGIVDGVKTNEARSFVRVKGKYAALWPFLGICAEVLILCTIIFIYEKRRDKTEMEESDTDQGPETKSSPDHGADSIRHRK